jgi:hypothetical protein
MELLPLHQLFDIQYGVNLELIHLKECSKEDENSIRFISRTEKNNGISAFVEQMQDVHPNSAHTISVACGGSVLSSFYQKKSYYSGRDIYVLMPKKEMTEVEMLFYTFCIRKNKYRYNYGRQANKTLKNILVPEKMPDNFYDINIQEIEKVINKASLINEKFELKTEQWQSFPLSKIFEIKGTKTTSLIELQGYGKGFYPYVTTQATTNGTEGLYNVYTETGNVITIDSAVLGYASYQAHNFSASDHVEKLIPKFILNKYNAIFLVTILNLEQYRYNYGRKCSQERIKNRSIRLPSKNNQPDWEFMENYMKSLPYSASL